MKTLNEILRESLLDTDFDVSVEDIYADNITNKIIEIATASTIKNYDKTVKELYNLLRGAARKRQEQDTSSILRRLRMTDNTNIYMTEMNGITDIFIRRFVKNHRSYLSHLQLFKRSDGSGLVYVLAHQPFNPSPTITRDMKETLVFLKPAVYDDIVNAYGQR